jgi:hypothetical protein
MSIITAAKINWLTGCVAGHPGVDGEHVVVGRAERADLFFDAVDVGVVQAVHKGNGAEREERHFGDHGAADGDKATAL